MTLRTVYRTELGERLGYLGDDGAPCPAGVADLLRAPLARWGLSPKRAVLKHARDQLRAVGTEEGSKVTSDVLQRLVEIGECEEVYVGHEAYLAPAAPRWMLVGEGVAAYLGVAEPPADAEILERGPDDVVRRVRIETDDEAAILEVAGVREVELDEWLAPLAYLRLAARRKRLPAIRSDTLPLCTFWKWLEEAVMEEALPLSSDAEIRCVVGEPGGFFGDYKAPDPEGRWTVNLEDGFWCGYRRGYGEAHWHPCLVAVTEGERRALDLYDADEWRWALLARGRALGTEDVVRQENGYVTIEFPPPAQLRTAMEVIGTPAGAWKWEVSAGAPNPWSYVP